MSSLKDAEEKYKMFMNSHRSKKGEPYTHTLFGGGNGTFNIPDKDMAQFLTLYKRVLSASIANKVLAPLFVVEKQLPVGPFVIDLDFKQLEKKRTYTQEHVQFVVKTFTDTIKKYIEYDEDSEQLYAYYFEKDSPSYDSKQNKYKDGFHVIYPNLYLTAPLKYYITKKTEEIVEKSGVLDDLNMQNTYDEVFDKSVIARNGWMMYGSRKETGKLYKLVKIFDDDGDESDLIDSASPEELVSILCLRREPNAECFQVKDKSEKFSRLVETAYGKYKKPEPIKPAPKVEIKEEDKDTEDEIDIDIDIVSCSKTKKLQYEANPLNNSDIVIARKMARILSANRAGPYATWIQVGWSLHNIDRSLLDEFIRFSKRSPKNYREGCCEEVWDKARDVGFGMSSLCLWAKEDNLKEYINIVSELINPLVVIARSGRHSDVARVIYHMYRYNFKCASIKKNIWYEFQGDRWRVVDMGYTLENKISDELPVEIFKTMQLQKDKTTSLDQYERDYSNSVVTQLVKVANKLGDEGYLHSIMSACRKRFHDNKFEEKLDENPYLLGFENGIYDLKAQIFRQGTPDDNVLMSTGYDYIKNFDPKNPSKNKPHLNTHYRDIHAFFDKVMTDKEMKTYLLTELASELEGVIKDQTFILWTGTGANGKSSTVNLWSYAMGQYFGVLPVTVVTKKRGSSSGATPELADKRGKRSLTVQEPEHDDTVYVGNMKNLSGADWIETRALYGDPFRYKPQFHLRLTCNKLPRIPSGDGGTWRRLRVVPFMSKFVSNPKEPREFPKDRDLEEKLKKWGPMFMWILINEYYPIYAKEGLYEPKLILEQTEKYQKDSDMFFEYLCNNMQISKESNTHENISAIYNGFRFWCKETGNGTAPPPRKDLENYFIDNNYKFYGGNVYGVKFNEVKMME